MVNSLVHNGSNALWHLLRPSLGNRVWHLSSDVNSSRSHTWPQLPEAFRRRLPARAIHVSQRLAGSQDASDAKKTPRLFPDWNTRPNSQIERAIRLKAIKRRRSLRSRPQGAGERKEQRLRNVDGLFKKQLLALLESSIADPQGSYESALTLWEKRSRLPPWNGLFGYNVIISLAANANKFSEALDLIEQVSASLRRRTRTQVLSSLRYISILYLRSMRHSSRRRAIARTLGHIRPSSASQ